MTAEAQQSIAYPPLRWYRLALLAMAITLIASVVLQTEYASAIAWLALPLYWLWLASEAASSSRYASAPPRWRAQWLLAAAIVSYFGINALTLKAAAILIPITAVALLYDYGYRRAAIILA